MLIEEFSFGNYRSFKEVQTLRMQAAKIVSANKELDTQNVIQVNEKTELLKSKIVYGANASGKSNVMKAMLVFVGIIKNCLALDNTIRIVEPFLYSTETENEPSFFQLIFYMDGVKYRYGFEATNEKVYSEWLYITHNVREVPVFIRDGQEIVEISITHMPEGHEISKLKNKLFTERVLFLTFVSTFADKMAEKVVDGITDIVFFTSNSQAGIAELDKGIRDILIDNTYKELTLHFLRYADVGLKNINLLKKEQAGDKENDTLLLSSHTVYDRDLNEVGDVDSIFEFRESAGTQQMLRVSPLIMGAIKKGQPLIIDEFGSQLHPLLTKKILELFNTKLNGKSQIIALSHSTELMSSDLLRKDQIDFVEKDKYGQSYLYTLVEMKGVRNTASFEKDYFNGKYGAIPFLGNWNELAKICDDTIEQKDEKE